MSVVQERSETVQELTQDYSLSTKATNISEMVTLMLVCYDAGYGYCYCLDESMKRNYLKSPAQ